jgi:hypothetical protein
LATGKGAVKWSGAMKKSVHKNPHAVALGRLGGLVRSAAKHLANQENGRCWRPSAPRIAPMTNSLVRRVIRRDLYYWIDSVFKETEARTLGPCVPPHVGNGDNEFNPDFYFLSELAIW